MSSSHQANLEELSDRYEIITRLGSGAYGTVYKARDLATGDMVAIKLIPNLFRTPSFAKKHLREIQLLHLFTRASCDYVVALRDVARPTDLLQFNDLYIVMDLMPMDLSRVINCDPPEVITANHIQYLAFQLVLGIAHLQSHGVLHRDLKGSNILVNEECELKIADFGMARMAEDAEVPMTEYVITRWYRPPEVLLGRGYYSAAADMWSVGCLLAELFTRHPIFPGRDTRNQMEKILEFTGTPLSSELPVNVCEGGAEFCLARRLEPRTIEELLEDAPVTPSSAACDLISRMLCFKAEDRISAEEALRHPYFEDVFQESDLPQPPEHCYFDASFETTDSSIGTLRAHFLQVISEFHPEILEPLVELSFQEDLPLNLNCFHSLRECQRQMLQRFEMTSMSEEEKAWLDHQRTSLLEYEFHTNADMNIGDINMDPPEIELFGDEGEYMMSFENQGSEYPPHGWEGDEEEEEEERESP